MDFSPIWISLKTAGLSVTITFFLGIFLAFWVFSIKSRKLKIVFDAFLTLPLVLPPTVAGFLLLYVFGTNRPVGAFLLNFFGVKIVFNWWATVLAAVVISLPLMYRSARAAFMQVDETLLQAAQTLGKTQWTIFWQVLLPLALPGIAAGGILAFARALGEFGATAMLAGNIAGQTRTLPLAVYSAVASGNTNGAFAYILVLLGISFFATVGLSVFTEVGAKK